jgi:hypothetical protein
VVDAVADKKEKGRGSTATDKAPALPPKKHSRDVSIASSLSPSPSTGRGGGGDSYSRVTPLQQQQKLQDNQQRRLSESLEKLAQQITINSTPLSYPHPVAPPRSRWSTAAASASTSPSSATHSSTPSPSPPQLPPKISIVHAKLATSERNTTTPSPPK